MKSIYLETSALLTWLLNENGSAEVISALDRADEVMTSRLTLLECRRNLIRLQSHQTIKEAERLRLMGLVQETTASWMFMEMTSEVMERAGEIFPKEPIRSLDAIHLATALEFSKLHPDLIVISKDKKVLENAEALGLGFMNINKELALSYLQKIKRDRPFADMEHAASTGLDFWDNEIDDEVWNDSKTR